MQAQATLRIRFSITAMYFNGKFDFISFWLSYPTITLIQKSWQPKKTAKESASGELCTKGAFLGAIEVCNRSRNVRQIRKSLFKKKWDPFSWKTLNDGLTANVQGDTRSSLKPEVFNRTLSFPPLPRAGLILGPGHLLILYPHPRVVG